MEKPDNAWLRRMLAERNHFPERAAQIDDAVRAAFEKTVALLVMDMCGFSRMTVQYGIMHYLAMIEQMERAARPAVEGNGGIVIKQEADNLYASFPSPGLALEGAIDIFRAFQAVNSVLPPERWIRGSIGIGFGPTLVIEDSDLFSVEMNLACKLGEDLACADEILLTNAAFAALPRDGYTFEPAQYVVSQLCIDAWRFRGKLFGEE